MRKLSSVRFFLHWLGAMSHFLPRLNCLIWTHQEQEVPKHKTRMISLRIRMWDMTGVISSERNTKKPDRMSGFFHLSWNTVNSLVYLFGTVIGMNRCCTTLNDRVFILFPDELHFTEGIIVLNRNQSDIAWQNHFKFFGHNTNAKTISDQFQLRSFPWVDSGSFRAKTINQT